MQPMMSYEASSPYLISVLKRFGEYTKNCARDMTGGMLGLFYVDYYVLINLISRLPYEERL